MADFKERFNPSYTHRAAGYADREATASSGMGAEAAATLTGSMLSAADKRSAPSSFEKIGSNPDYYNKKSGNYEMQ